MLQLAVHDTYFAINPSTEFATFLTPSHDNAEHRLPEPNGADDARQAVAGAAITMLRLLYLESGGSISRDATAQLQHLLQKSIDEFPGLDQNSASYRFGASVASVVFRLLPTSMVRLRMNTSQHPVAINSTMNRHIPSFSFPSISMIRTVPRELCVSITDRTTV
jgi:hypothetical protein